MMGQQLRVESLCYYFRFEDQIREDHLLRLIDRYADFTFVRERLKELLQPDPLRDQTQRSAAARQTLSKLNHVHGVGSDFHRAGSVDNRGRGRIATDHREGDLPNTGPEVVAVREDNRRGGLRRGRESERVTICCGPALGTLGTRGVREPLPGPSEDEEILPYSPARQPHLNPKCCGRCTKSAAPATESEERQPHGN